MILHCLAPDPADRPDSACAVAMALPGGDPLAAALAAGETPSPEMVAGAGADIGISVRAAVSCLMLLVASILVGQWISDDRQIAGAVSLDLPPDALAARAREVCRAFGYPAKPRDRAFGMAYDTDYLQHMWTAKDRRPLRDRRPSPIYFWYRESPSPLLPGSVGGVRYLDPPPSKPGMLSLQLDSAGHLIQFGVVPVAVAPATPAFDNWRTLFGAAGLDMRDFEETGSQWAPPLLPDMRKAWNGSYPGQPEPLIRVEAGTKGGRVVYFRIFHPWVSPQDGEPIRVVGVRPGVRALMNPVGAVWMWALVLLSSVLAWRNLRSGRGDRRGAFRIAVYIFVVQLIQAIAVGDLAHPFERELPAIHRSVMLAFQVWLAYIGLEPLARRIWPQALITWSRLLSGRWRDPLLGRDLLIGITAGCAFVTAVGVTAVGVAWSALSTGTLVGYALPVGLGSIVETMAIPVSAPVLFGITFVVSLSGLWAILGRKWAAALVGWALLTAVFVSAAGGYAIVVPQAVTWAGIGLVVALYVILLLRVGLTTMITCMVTVVLNLSLPGGLDFSAWHQQPGRINALLLFALGLYAFRIALAGRPILGAKLDER
ncbi:MAG: hypothetical protein HY820_23510 [Acidobacteria bacterium]|nr:hypothetical protein [Acidobacteriota bacterium]